jgi:creatinine amidohydrolase
MKTTFSPFPSYRDRYLPSMTARQIAALPDKEWAPLIVTTGAIEQHGPHLPVAVDSFLAQVWLEYIFKHLTPEISAYTTLPITIGKSNEHVGFPGTLYISKDTLREHLLVLARQAKAWGFRQFIILNTHGGNSAVINYTLREIRTTLGLRADWIRTRTRHEVPPLEAAYGFHANLVETALLLAKAPQYTHQERAVCWYAGKLEDPGELRPEFAPATFSWASQDISPSGIMGDAVSATAEQGQQWHDAQGAGYVDAIARLCEEGRRLATSG